MRVGPAVSACAGFLDTRPGRQPASLASRSLARSPVCGAIVTASRISNQVTVGRRQRRHSSTHLRQPSLKITLSGTSQIAPASRDRCDSATEVTSLSFSGAPIGTRYCCGQTAAPLGCGRAEQNSDRRGGGRGGGFDRRARRRLGRSRSQRRLLRISMPRRRPSRRTSHRWTAVVRVRRTGGLTCVMDRQTGSLRLQWTDSGSAERCESRERRYDRVRRASPAPTTRCSARAVHASRCRRIRG